MVAVSLHPKHVMGSVDGMLHDGSNAMLLCICGFHFSLHGLRDSSLCHTWAAASSKQCEIGSLLISWSGQGPSCSLIDYGRGSYTTLSLDTRPDFPSIRRTIVSFCKEMTVYLPSAIAANWCLRSSFSCQSRHIKTREPPRKVDVDIRTRPLKLG